MARLSTLQGRTQFARRQRILGQAYLSRVRYGGHTIGHGKRGVRKLRGNSIAWRRSKRYGQQRAAVRGAVCGTVGKILGNFRTELDEGVLAHAALVFLGNRFELLDFFWRDIG